MSAEKPRQTASIHAKVTPEEERRMKERAEEEGRSLSSWIRWHLIRALRR